MFHRKLVKQRTWLLVSVLGLLSVGVACGATATPVVIEKEVPVVKEVVKEVPVEKEVVKEVVKEVPVEKEVVKEVEVIKKIIVTATPVPTVPKAVVPEGELRIAIAEMGTETMDPTLNTNSGKATLAPFYDYLVGVATDGSLSTETGAAEFWEVGRDSMSLSLRVRPGIVFHNGDELTSADIKWGLSEFLSDRAVSSHADLLRGIIEDVQTPDRMSVEISYKKPNAVLANYLSRQQGNEGAVLPMSYMQEVGKDNFNLNPVGSGPYMFLDQKVGIHLKYEAADLNWRVGVPKYQFLTFYRVNEESTRLAMLKTGGADIVQIGRDKIKEVSDYAVYVKQGAAVVGLYLNNTWDTTTYLGNEEFREALALAINREEIRDFIFEGQAVVMGSGTAYGSYALEYEPVPLVGFDPVRAQQLVQAAFPGDTPKLDVYVFPLLPEMGRLAEAVASYWNDIGVESKIIPIEYSTYRKELAQDEPDLRNSIGVMRLGNRLLWDGAYNILYHSEGLLAMAHESQLDTLIETLRSEVDPGMVGQRQRDVALYMRDHHTQIAIVETGDVYAANPEVVPEWPNVSTPLAYDLYLDDLYTR